MPRARPLLGASIVASLLAAAPPACNTLDGASSYTTLGCQDCALDHCAAAVAACTTNACSEFTRCLSTTCDPQSSDLGDCVRQCQRPETAADPGVGLVFNCMITTCRSYCFHGGLSFDGGFPFDGSPDSTDAPASEIADAFDTSDTGACAFDPAKATCAGTDGGTATGIFCNGGALCERCAATQHCCQDFGTTNGCRTSCDSTNGIDWQCKGGVECSGLFCCAPVNGAPSTTCPATRDIPMFDTTKDVLVQCKPSCDAGEITLCRGDSDCPSGAPTCAQVTLTLPGGFEEMLGQCK